MVPAADPDEEQDCGFFMFTTNQIIEAAREMTGCQVEDSPGQRWVSDAAIENEMLADIMQACKAFGSSSSLKEWDFTTTQMPPISTPGVPTVTPSTSGGTLSANTYSYRVSATYGTRETYVSGATQATTTGSTSSNAITWTAVSNATGYKVYGRTLNYEYLLGSTTGTTFTDNGSFTPSSGPPIQSNAWGWIQDYNVSTFIGSDVLDVVEVIRTDAYRAENFAEPCYDVDPITGVRGRYGGFIDQSLQEGAFEVIQAQARWRETDKYTWKMVNISGSRYLRLMPKPEFPVTVRVTYQSTSDTIESMPDEAKPAMMASAARSIIDCQLNRIKAEPSGSQFDGPLEKRGVLDAMAKQRDRYAVRFDRCLQLAR